MISAHSPSDTWQKLKRSAQRQKPVEFCNTIPRKRPIPLLLIGIFAFMPTRDFAPILLRLDAATFPDARGRAQFLAGGEALMRPILYSLIEMPHVGYPHPLMRIFRPAPFGAPVPCA
jgi:hypothetical protein